MDSIHSRKPANVGSQDRSAFSLFIPGLILFILNTLWGKLWAFYQQGFEASSHLCRRSIVIAWEAKQNGPKIMRLVAYLTVPLSNRIFLC
ncbi:hypothetical protein SAMN05216308_11146 [Nitrosospira sp. Nsp13]|nr:hypothetical protein SAMN05216308_11146 [Nitrosospira sp. Nsp13]